MKIHDKWRNYITFMLINSYLKFKKLENLRKALNCNFFSLFFDYWSAPNIVKMFNEDNVFNANWV